MFSMLKSKPGLGCHAISAWLVAGIFLVTLEANAVTQVREGGFLVESWQREHGLPDTTVSALAQTVDGFLWVGTPKGLVRFDGVRFKNIPLHPEKPETKENVTALFKERGGRLWIGTESGDVFQLTGEGYASLTHAGSVGSRVTSFASDELGTLWVLAQNNSIQFLKTSGGGFQEYEDADFRPTGFTTDSQGVVWGWSMGGLYQLRLRGGRCVWWALMLPLVEMVGQVVGWGSAIRSSAVWSSPVGQGGGGRQGRCLLDPVG
jgi:ligand-binding sensor domain-containing protein